jgi:hypothetical protein
VGRLTPTFLIKQIEKRIEKIREKNGSGKGTYEEQGKGPEDLILLFFFLFCILSFLLIKLIEKEERGKNREIIEKRR